MSERVIEAVADAIVEPSEWHLDDEQCRAVAIAAIAAFLATEPTEAEVEAAAEAAWNRFMGPRAYSCSWSKLQDDPDWSHVLNSERAAMRAALIAARKAGQL